MSDLLVGSVAEWGKIAVSVLVIATFHVALILIWRVSDQPDYHDVFVFMGTTAGTGYTLAIGYWLGSSAGSAKKTDIIQRQNKPT